MASIWLILIVSAIIYLFWLDRQAAESARSFAERHCEQQKVQFLSIACSKKRLAILRNGKPGLKTEFAWEFSSNGQDSYAGTVTLENERVTKVDMPAYKIN